MIKFENVSVTYPGGVEALKDLDLEINEGDFLIIVGLSGAGKSTLLRTINNLVKPSNGDRISDYISKLTIITNEMVKNKPTIKNEQNNEKIRNLYKTMYSFVHQIKFMNQHLYYKTIQKSLQCTNVKENTILNITSKTNTNADKFNIIAFIKKNISRQ